MFRRRANLRYWRSSPRAQGRMRQIRHSSPIANFVCLGSVWGSLLCPSYVPPMSLVFPSYVPPVSLLCSCYVPPMSLLCPSYVPHMSLLVSVSACPLLSAGGEGRDRKRILQLLTSGLRASTSVYVAVSTSLWSSLWGRPANPWT